MTARPTSCAVFTILVPISSDGILPCRPTAFILHIIIFFRNLFWPSYFNASRFFTVFSKLTAISSLFLLPPPVPRPRRPSRMDDNPSLCHIDYHTRDHRHDDFILKSITYSLSVCHVEISVQYRPAVRSISDAINLEVLFLTSM